MSITADAISTATSQKILMAWSDQLSVGIQEIDDQHKVLIDFLNQLHNAILHHHGADACGQIMDKLCEYTKIHFAVEESILRILDYPDYEDHKNHHENLLSQVRSLRLKMQTEDHSISFELLHFLKKWLTIHIMEEDTAYTAHLLSCGAQATTGKKTWVNKFWNGLKRNSKNNLHTLT